MSVDRSARRPIPIGVHSFREICDEGYCYVDKTLFIKEVLDAKAKVTLFTRPRRFGKTLNMNMLRTFFEKTDADTSWCFRNKKIWEAGPKYTDRQGKYPVIYVSFADATGTWEELYGTIAAVLRAEYKRHLFGMAAPLLNDFDRDSMMSFVRGDADIVQVRRSLLDLSEMLHTAYGVAPIILIDEYDTPIESAWESGIQEYDRMVTFMRNLLSPALKDNDHLSFACLTGVLRVAKEGLFSGLNNLMVDGVLDVPYDESFGFTPDEVRGLANEYGLGGEKYEEIRHWYQGYTFGERKVFNPWSVLMYLAKDCVAKAYWANTSDKGVLGEVLFRGDARFLKGLSSLIEGGKVWSTVSDSLVYPSLVRGNVTEAAYTLLLMSGYLTSTGRTRIEGGREEWELAIPNMELANVYPEEILDAMPDRFDADLCWTVRKAILDGRPEELGDALTTLLMRSVSFFDLGKEKGYQMWLLGLLASMPGYRVTSNREAGEGRFDICLRPRAARNPGVLIEVKYDKNKEAPREKMEDLAADAVRQIRKLQYAEDLRAEDVRDILEFGMAFCGKKAFVVTGDMVPKTEE